MSAADVIRLATRAEMRKRGLRHRSVYLKVSNTGGELLVQQRSNWKDLWPSRWEIGCGGVLAVGETFDEAARRELAEELGIDTEPHWVGMNVYRQPPLDVIGGCYELTWDGPITFADGEVQAVEWMTASEILGHLSRRQWCPDSLAIWGFGR